MFGFAIYVHFYHVFLNISNLLEVVLMHKHCPNHFCITGVKMSIVVLIDKSCKLCSKTVFFLIQTFIPTSLKRCFPYIQMGMNHTCQSHTILHSLTLDFWLWLLLDFFMEIFCCCIWTCLYVSCMPHWYLINFMT